MEALTESFIFYPAERFDIVGKQLLKASRKLYIVDLGLRNHILPAGPMTWASPWRTSSILNCCAGLSVMIGRLGSTEVDFVAEKQGEYTYYQVTADMTAEETFQRELRP